MSGGVSIVQTAVGRISYASEVKGVGNCCFEFIFLE